MRPGLRTLVGSATALLLMLAVATLSQLPYTFEDSDRAVLRLSWRAPARVEEACRALSTEELERLPVHMRNPEACRRRSVPYRLEVRVDGAIALRELVQPAGARGDRPIYVFRDLAVAPGAHRVRVLFAAEEDDSGEQDEEGEREEGERRGEAAQAEQGRYPGPLAFEGAVHFAARDVVLITYDPTARQLVLRGAGAP